MKFFGYLFLLFLIFSSHSLYAKNLSSIRSSAEKGDSVSMFQLGNYYFYGLEGVKQNFTLAAYWYQRAANAGVVEAMFNYAVCLDRGFGVKQNRYQAYLWYQKAAERGSKHAKYNLAQILFSGIQEDKENDIPGVKASPQQAFYYVNELADEGFEPAEILLAEMLLEQHDKPEAVARAAKILLRLAKNKNPNPKVLRMLADCKYAGRGMKSDSTEMLCLLEQAVALGDGEAAGKLAFCYEYGRGCKADEKKAFELYQLGAKRGNAMSQFKVAEFLILGRPEGTEPDVRTAVKWYETAAKAGNRQALFRLGVFALDGMGPIEKNPQKAADYFYQSAKMGYAQAQYNLACLFSEGRGVMKDDAAALYWYLQAAKNGDAAAARTIGIYYLEGKGVTKSITKAEQWLRRAAEKGDFEAQRILRTRFR